MGPASAAPPLSLSQKIQDLLLLSFIFSLSFISSPPHYSLAGSAPIPSLPLVFSPFTSTDPSHPILNLSRSVPPSSKPPTPLCKSGLLPPVSLHPSYFLLFFAALGLRSWCSALDRLLDFSALLLVVS
ncbi:hypothetical protein Scep_028341 [Stephania cephalantha]|uniref:Uncharacterized protein n=1 Tax=Stephania cephalantha TaxID=152367 RepID=A0AAP0EI66_9MAGN